MLVSLFNIKKKKKENLTENMSWNFWIQWSSYSFTYQHLILPLFYFHSQPLTSHMCRECPWCPGMLNSLFSSVAQLYLTLCNPMDYSTSGFAFHHQLPEPTQNSSPSHRWCHPTMSSSIFPFSSCLQSFPGSGSFPMSQFFVSGGQSIGVSASASVLPMNIPMNSPMLFYK